MDNRDSLEPKITPKWAVKICNRNFGISAGGVIFAMLGVNSTNYSMRIFNSNGNKLEVIHLLEESLFVSKSINFLFCLWIRVLSRVLFNLINPNQTKFFGLV